jgi:hypothetical protein
MTSIVEQVSERFINENIGLVSGSFAGLQFPNLPCKLVRFKALSYNTGSIFIGETANDLFYELDAGDDTGWVVLGNLNELWYGKSSGTADHLTYWIQN